MTEKRMQKRSMVAVKMQKYFHECISSPTKTQIQPLLLLRKPVSAQKRLLQTRPKAVKELIDRARELNPMKVTAALHGTALGS